MAGRCTPWALRRETGRWLPAPQGTRQHEGSMAAAHDVMTPTRVGPGTPMGDLLRRYWIPALMSEQLTEAGGAPTRVRLLGENLVAFRSPDGRIGLVEENCPHRGASLAYGRN